jgi:cyanophycinase
MRLLLALSVLIAFFMTPRMCEVAQKNDRKLGPLLLVGGGEMDEPIRQRFITLAGGPEALIVIIPTASVKYQDGLESKAAWKKAGAKKVVVLHTLEKTTANKPEFYGLITKASGVWIGGGDQDRFMSVYRGTCVEIELNNLRQRGGVIGGTSAGASVIRGGDKPQPARGGRSVLRPAEVCPVVKPPNRTASCSTQSFLL